jgi:hypothetical protein
MAERQARSAARQEEWANSRLPLAEIFRGAVADNWGWLVAVAVVATVLGVVFRHHLAWGDVPTWVLAALTLLAFAAAAFAGVVAYDLLRTEQDRDVAREDAERRAQASKVAAWYGTWRSEITYSGGAVSGPPSWPHSGAVIRNASDLPVYDVRVSFCVAVSSAPAPGWRAEERYSSPEPILVIAPGEEHVELPGNVRERETADGNEPKWLVGIQFTDADGRRWLRAPNGQLRVL